MAAPRWSIRNYNAFIREARSEWDLGLDEARKLYREVRDWKGASAYGADVDRYADYLQTEAGTAQVYDSILYDFPDVVPEAELPDTYPDDAWLDEGAELELTAETYGDEE